MTIQDKRFPSVLSPPAPGVLAAIFVVAVFFALTISGCNKKPPRTSAPPVNVTVEAVRPIGTLADTFVSEIATVRVAKNKAGTYTNLDVLEHHQTTPEKTTPAE